MKTVYNYGPDGAYIGSSTARENPRRKGEYLLPGGATFLEPPAASDNEVAVFENGAWIIKSDFRRVVYWLPDGSRHEITEIGKVKPVNALDKAPKPAPPSAEEVIRQAHDQINAMADLIYTNSTSLDRRYANKRAEALRFIEAGKPADIAEVDYPYLVKEARAREVEPSVLADLIISMASGFDAFGSDAEEARAAVTVAVNKADPDQRQSAAQAIVNDLKAKAAALA